MHAVFAFCLQNLRMLATRDYSGLRFFTALRPCCAVPVLRAALHPCKSSGGHGGKGDYLVIRCQRGSELPIRFGIMFPDTVIPVVFEQCIRRRMPHLKRCFIWLLKIGAVITAV